MEYREAKELFDREYWTNLATECHGNVSKMAKLSGKYRADVYEINKRLSINLDDHRGKIFHSVYFVQGEHTKLIKIGKSINITKRFNTLQASGPERLILLAVTSEYNESSLHVKFAHLRMHGEWFRPEPDLLAFVDSLSNGRC